MPLIELPRPLPPMPGTRYFEVDSSKVGARFAVWVTLPARYEQEPQARYPAVYLPDGNSTSLWAPALPILRDDPINPIAPLIQVCVGYAGEDAPRMLAVRARDLLPPGEALAPGTDEKQMDMIVAMGLLSRADADLYWHHLNNPAADKFLDFLSEELHPLIAERFRVDDSSLGLFGYSYGGLFAAYAAMRRTRFLRIGAGSPGIASRISKVFELYAAERAADADHSGRMLHMTVCEKEISAPSMYQVLVGAGTVEFMHLAGQQPLRGLRFSTHIAPHDSHFTGSWPSWNSYLRTCYGVHGTR